MRNAPKLEGIVKDSVEGFFIVEINGRKYPFSKFTSKKFLRPQRKENVLCYFGDPNQIYINKIQTKDEELIYSLKK